METYRIPRDRIRFDVFEAYARYAQTRRTSFRDSEVLEDYLSQVRESINRSLDSPAFLHGQRTEAMFEGLVVSLGRIKLIRWEDAGDVYVFDEAIKVPDFQLVLQSGERLLVEVKNFFSTRGLGGLTLRPTARYIDGLLRYADLMNCSLKFAVYWANLNIWTLVPPSSFVRRGSRMELTFGHAMGTNEFAKLGDLTIGTRAPLRLRLIADPSQPRSFDEQGEVAFTIGGVQIYCADRELIDPTERHIAQYLMFFGSWQEAGPEPIFSDEGLEGIEYLVHPDPEDDASLGFSIIGSLSGMFSRYFASETADIETDDVNQILAGFSPGRLGQLIPSDYKANALPLWRFELMPWTDAELERFRNSETEPNARSVKERRGAAR